MKILYVAPGHYWGSTWPYAFIDQYIIQTLKEMGHEVSEFQIFPRINSFFGFYQSVAKEKNWNQAQLLAALDDRATADLPLEIISFMPDLVLHTVGRIPQRTLEAIRKLKVKTAIWFLDDPQEIDFTSKKGTFYDYVFTVEEKCVDAHKQAGSKNATFLPLGCFPRIQKKMEVEDNYRSDICFIGVPFPRRVEIFDSLADYLKDLNVKIIGGGPNIGSAKDPWMWKRKLKRLDVLERFIKDEIVFPEEAAKYYNGAKINLNIHRAAIDARFEKGNSNGIIPTGISGRTFEIAGCAGFQLIDEERIDYKRHFEAGKEIIAFSDVEDLKKKAEYYLKRDDERKAIGEAAQKRTYSEHTYEKRLRKVFFEIFG